MYDTIIFHTVDLQLPEERRRNEQCIGGRWESGKRQREGERERKRERREKGKREGERKESEWREGTVDTQRTSHLSNPADIKRPQPPSNARAVTVF